MKEKFSIITVIAALFLVAPFAGVVKAQDNTWLFPGTEAKVAGIEFNRSDMYRFSNLHNVFSEGLDSKALIAMFGESKVCVKKGKVVDGKCELIKEAQAWRKSQVDLMRGRHAEGMLITAMRNFLERDAIWKNGLRYIFDFKTLSQRHGVQVEYSSDIKPNEELSNYISYYQTLKELEEVYTDGFRQRSLRMSSKEFIDTLIDSFRTKKEFYTIEIGTNFGRSYRPLLPFEVYRMGTSTTYRISVYDGNCPETVGHLFIAGDNSRKLRYQPCNGRAEDFGGWLSLTPITTRFNNNKNFKCPFGKGKSPALAEGSADDDTEKIYFSFNGSGDLLITDPDAKQIGYDGKTKKEVNQISGATIIYDVGSSDSVFSPRYALPHNEEAKEPYRVLISGDDLKKESNANLTVTGPGFVVGFENISLDPKEKLTVSISPDGKTLSFTASADRETPTLFVTTSDGQDNSSYSFKVGGVAIEAGKTLTMTVDIEEGKVYFKDNDGKEDAYDIRFEKLNPDGTEAIFVKDDVKSEGEDSYQVDISNWDKNTKPCVKDKDGNSLDEDCESEEEDK